jgi:hypothetical protein
MEQTTNNNIIKITNKNNNNNKISKNKCKNKNKNKMKKKAKSTTKIPKTPKEILANVSLNKLQEKQDTAKLVYLKEALQNTIQAITTTIEQPPKMYILANTIIKLSTQLAQLQDKTRIKFTINISKQKQSFLTQILQNHVNYYKNIIKDQKVTHIDYQNACKAMTTINKAALAVMAFFTNPVYLTQKQKQEERLEWLQRDCKIQDKLDYQSYREQKDKINRINKEKYYAFGEDVAKIMHCIQGLLNKIPAIDYVQVTLLVASIIDEIQYIFIKRKYNEITLQAALLKINEQATRLKSNILNLDANPAMKYQTIRVTRTINIGFRNLTNLISYEYPEVKISKANYYYKLAPQLLPNTQNLNNSETKAKSEPIPETYESDNEEVPELVEIETKSNDSLKLQKADPAYELQNVSDFQLETQPISDMFD